MSYLHILAAPAAGRSGAPHGLRTGPASLPALGLPGLLSVGQAPHLLFPRSGQAFGQAAVSSVHGTTSTRRCALLQNLPFTLGFAPHVSVIHGAGAVIL